MGQLGIGAMLHMLGGGTEHGAEEYVGKTITDAKIIDDRLRISFADKEIEIWDDGQMTTDDDVSTLIGGVLQRIEPKAGECKTGEYDDEHETVFIEVGTDKGFITIVNHNEHNGYYGGFGLTITERQ